MKKLTMIPVLCLVLFVATNAFAWNMGWFNQAPWVGPDGTTPIAPGGMVQLIVDGGDGVITDPMTEFAGDATAIGNWIAAGCLPIGDDTLVVSSGPGAQTNPQYFQDYGNPAYNGYWGDPLNNYVIGTEAPGAQMYTRFFTAENPGECDYYGTMGDIDGVGQFYTLEVDGAGFAKYIFDEGVVGVAGTHIVIPEPATMLIGGVALLLGFFRRKK